MCLIGDCLKLKAAIYKSQGKLEIIETERPVLKDRGAIIKVVGCGLCGSDLIKLKRDSDCGAVFGHEVVGTILEIDPNNKSFKIGDLVSVRSPCSLWKVCVLQS